MSSATETTPLIDREPSTRTSTRYIWDILPLALIMLVLDTSMYLSVGPETAIFEEVACSAHYRTGDAVFSMEQRECKIEPVQSEVAFIIAWRQALEIIPGILCAVPFGALADRIGRKKVLLCSIVGCFLSDTWVRLVCYFPNVFPLRLVLLSGIWQFFGGGATTLSSIVWVMIADLTPPEQRTSAFSQIQATFLISEFISVSVSAPLMTIDPWIPYLIASICMLLGIILTATWVSESFPREDAVDKTPSTNVEQLFQMASWIRKHLNVLLVLVSFSAVQLGRQIVNILLQYASNKFSWTLSQASYLIMIRSATSLALLVAMPLLTKLAGVDSFHTRMVCDKRFTQLSGCFLVVGSMASFAANHPGLLISGQVLSGIGSALTVTARSLVTGMVEQEHLGMLYGAVAVLSYGGILAGGPLIAEAFSLGLRIGGTWTGLPFLVSAGFFFFASMTISFVKLRDPDATVTEIES